jgi:hypothetical protein
MRRIALCLSALTVLGLAGVACGDDKGPRLTADEFAVQANAVCKEGDQKLADAGNNALKDATTPEKRVDFMIEYIVGSAKDKIEGISKLNPPKKDEAKVQKMLDVGEKAADQLEEGLKKEGLNFQGGGTPELLKEFDRLARELNLNDCASKS